MGQQGEIAGGADDRAEARPEARGTQEGGDEGQNALGTSSGTLRPP